MIILAGGEENIEKCAEVYYKSWRLSHKGIVSEDFLMKFDAKKAEKLLRESLASDEKLFYLSENNEIKGIVVISDKDNEIRRLYVKPDSTRKGYGSELLNFAVKQLDYEKPIKVTVMNKNLNAVEFYEKNGFVSTGICRVLNETADLKEIKFVLTLNDDTMKALK